MTAYTRGKWVVLAALWALSARAVGAGLDRDVAVSCRVGGEDPADYVVVLDVSGSMGNGGRLALCRRFLRAFVERLRTSDRLDVVTFNARPMSLFGKLAGVDASARSRVDTLLVSVRASGRTAIAPALARACRRAHAARPLRVLLLSDALTDPRERTDLARQIRVLPANAQVLCVGVGKHIDRPLLHRLAGDSGGLSVFLSPGDDCRLLSDVVHRDLGRGAPLTVVDRDALAAELQRDDAARTSMEAARAGRTRELKLTLPKPVFRGTPRRIRMKHRTPNRNRRIVVPAGVDVRNVARGKPVTSSDDDPIIGELKMVTDGDKKGDDGSFVELGPDKQWVQIDLKGRHDIYVVVVWRDHIEKCVYKDVIVQVADDPKFIRNVETVFNNDHDNSSRLGAGSDWQYLDTYLGEAIQLHPSEPVRGRYVRFYSNGNSANDLNRYVEIEIWGRPAR